MVGDKAPIHLVYERRKKKNLRYYSDSKGKAAQGVCQEEGTIATHRSKKEPLVCVVV